MSWVAARELLRCSGGSLDRLNDSPKGTVVIKSWQMKRKDLLSASTSDGWCGSGEQIWDLWGKLGFGCSLLLDPHLCSVGQVHQRLPLRTLLKVLAAHTFADGRTHDLCLMRMDIRMLSGPQHNWKLPTSSVWQGLGHFHNLCPLTCENTHLITLAVVFQTARFLTIAAFAVSPVRLSFFAFTNLGLKSYRVSV